MATPATAASKRASAGDGKARAAPPRKAAPRRRTAPPRPAAAGGDGDSLVPYLAVEDAAAAIAWYKEAFGAKEATRRLGPGGRVVHAEMRIGAARFYLSDVFPGSDIEHPTSLGGTTATLHLHAPDVDRLWARAVSAGGKVTLPLANQFWGERYGKLRDPFGHSWALSRPVDMTESEKARLEAEAMKAFEAAGKPGTP
jgi:PhnB protein